MEKRKKMDFHNSTCGHASTIKTDLKNSFVDLKLEHFKCSMCVTKDKKLRDLVKIDCSDKDKLIVKGFKE